MAGLPLHLTLARSFASNGAHYRVLARRLDDGSHASTAAEQEVASIELNRRIELIKGEAFAIERRGSPFAPAHLLVEAAGAGRDSPPLASIRREHAGWWWYPVLSVGERGESRFLLRRRAVFGSPANADLLARRPDATTSELSKMPVVLHVEKVGLLRQRLQASWLDGDGLSLPLVLFVLNLLADQDRRAAIAASAGAVGV